MINKKKNKSAERAHPAGPVPPACPRAAGWVRHVDRADPPRSERHSAAQPYRARRRPIPTMAVDQLYPGPVPGTAAPPAVPGPPRDFRLHRRDGLVDPAPPPRAGTAFGVRLSSTSRGTGGTRPAARRRKRDRLSMTQSGRDSSPPQAARRRVASSSMARTPQRRGLST